MPAESLHSRFALGLTDPESGLPAGVVDPEGRPAPKRYAVYRNNVSVSLVESLKAGHPAVLALIGEKPFELLALEFARAHPPETPVMIRYGEKFAGFLEGLPQLKGMPFLPDVARLEEAWLQSYHAADSSTLDPSGLASLSPEAFARLRFCVHPASRFVISRFPIVDLWNAGRNGAGRGIDPDLAQSALITRPDVDVNVLAVSAVSTPFVADLLAGKRLGEAAAAREGDEQFNLQKVMQYLLSVGVFHSIEVEG